jgi:hypothetical protein
MPLPLQIVAAFVGVILVLLILENVDADPTTKRMARILLLLALVVFVAFTFFR